jgi:sentrin-specific protease 1
MLTNTCALTSASLASPLSFSHVLPVQQSRIHFFSSFFYTKLSENGVYNYKNVSRWLKRAKVDIAQLEKIIMPVHVGHNHWCCAIINFAKQQIEYYDSLGGSNPQCLQFLRNYVRDEVQAQHPEKMSTLKLEEWRDVQMHGIPQQNNGSDW